MTEAAPSIALHGVGVEFGRVRALEAVDLQLRGGEIAALIGPNGSGKTTLLGVLAGLVRPTTGSVSASSSLGIAYVSQLPTHHQWMPMTTGEVILTARYRQCGLLRRLRPHDSSTCRSAAARLGVESLWSDRFTDLSGGQRQRVLIARALASEADVILLDEPITGLDPSSQNVIGEVMETERLAGRIVVFSTHHLEETRICDQVALVHGGILASGSPAEVITPTNLAELFGTHALQTPAEPMVVIDSHEHHHAPEPHRAGRLTEPPGAERTT